VHRIVDPVLTLLDLDLGCTDADHGDAAGELGQSLLELLAIVVGRGFLDLGFNLMDARLDVDLLTGAADNRGVVLLDRHLLGAAEPGERRFFS
jgi:hypothetical protein